ncbi:hypothetical protein [Oleiphilus sp. HI0043]|uniref:hypothetical protein n=2 Tax=unclassified Oleiphilus TaxID=2631174 RepID=UPI0012E821AD|nr:hypothetical protein [Oleiphilus sp. HI0043]
MSAEVANTLSLAIVLSATLMASLSFGSYRLLFKYADTDRANYYEGVRIGIFLFNLFLLIVIAVFLILYEFYHYEIIVFIGLFIISEHIVHDESRVYLYQGNREKWARHNFFRSLFIILIPLGVLIQPEVDLSHWMVVFFVITLITSVVSGGLLKGSARHGKILFGSNFYKEYLRQSNYFLSSFVSKFNQQSDRYLYALISYETLWIYTLIAQIGSLSLMFFEMTYMSNFKANIVKDKNYRFQFLSGPQLKTMSGTILISVLVYAVACTQLTELQESLNVICFVVFVAINLVAATNMLNSEKLFWYLNKPRIFTRIELFSFLFGHLLIVPIVLMSGLIVIVRIPTLFAYIFKIWNVRKCLKA